MLLTFNPGSSTIKLGLFAIEADAPRRLGKCVIDLRHQPLTLHIVEGSTTVDIPLTATVTGDLREVIEETLGWLSNHFSTGSLAAVGHRVVHGGDRFASPEAITDDTLDAIEALIQLAPLHQPQSVRLIKAIRHLYPALPQIASFDTAFHRSQSDLVRRFALPRALFDEGVKRYGFHGLSYKYIAARLEQVAPAIAPGRVVAAHLGSGASLCALNSGRSVDHSLGFTALDGLCMGTRPGALDPGVVLYLFQVLGMSAREVETVLYKKSGLLGISGISNDMRQLIGNPDPSAKLAVDYFVYRAAREIGGLAAVLGGVDGLVFTAGIGENSAEVRRRICEACAWLGVEVDHAANNHHGPRISRPTARPSTYVIPTNEELMIARHTGALLGLVETRARTAGN